MLQCGLITTKKEGKSLKILSTVTLFWGLLPNQTFNGKNDRFAVVLEPLSTTHTDKMQQIMFLDYGHHINHSHDKDYYQSII